MKPVKLPKEYLSNFPCLKFVDADRKKKNAAWIQKYTRIKKQIAKWTKRRKEYKKVVDDNFKYSCFKEYKKVVDHNFKHSCFQPHFPEDNYKDALAKSKLKTAQFAVKLWSERLGKHLGEIDTF